MDLEYSTNGSLFDPENDPGVNASFRSPVNRFWILNCSGVNAQTEDLCDPLVRTLLRVVDKLDVYLLPVIIFVGLIGNFLSFLVFSGTYLRRMSSSVYLAALAIADLVFLVFVFTSWLGNFHIELVHANVWCQVSVYVTYVASFLSVWYVVCFTVERHLIVCFPLHRQKICQPRRSKIVVCVLAVAALAMYNFALWTSEVDEVFGQPLCAVHHSRFFQIVTSINNADTVLTLVLPALVISVSNVRISYALAKFQRTHCQARRVSSRSSSASGSLRLAAGPLVGPNSSYNRLQMRVTKMLLVVSSIFLLCNIPSHAIRVYAFARSAISPDYTPSRKLLIVQRLAMLLYYAGFSANFVLYNISGRTFRRAFLHLFRCVAHRAVALCSRMSRSRTRATRQQKRTVVRLRTIAHECAYN